MDSSRESHSFESCYGFVTYIRNWHVTSIPLNMAQNEAQNITSRPLARLPTWLLATMPFTCQLQQLQLLQVQV